MTIGIKSISPSRVDRYYLLECPRFLRYSATARADRIAEGVPATPFDVRPINRALADGRHAPGSAFMQGWCATLRRQGRNGGWNSRCRATLQVPASRTAVADSAVHHSANRVSQE